MTIVERTDSESADFIALVKQLDTYLAEIDGSEHAFYAQFNKIDKLKNAVVVYEDQHAVACGAMKKYSDGVIEVKRMYTLPESRGKGYAAVVLEELEKWAKELGYTKCILETGKRQPSAITLYEKSSYARIPNFEPYEKDENSVCFEKEL